jgi:hypothetical protein
MIPFIFGAKCFVIFAASLYEFAIASHSTGKHKLKHCSPASMALTGDEELLVDLLDENNLFEHVAARSVCFPPPQFAGARGRQVLTGVVAVIWKHADCTLRFSPVALGGPVN